MNSITPPPNFPSSSLSYGKHNSEDKINNQQSSSPEVDQSENLKPEPQVNKAEKEASVIGLGQGQSATSSELNCWIALNSDPCFVSNFDPFLNAISGLQRN